MLVDYDTNYRSRDVVNLVSVFLVQLQYASRYAKTATQLFS